VGVNKSLGYNTCLDSRSTGARILVRRSI